jgi:hypothetical protein
MAADDPTKQRFEILRKRAQQAAKTQTQQEREGLQRRFAQIGQVGSGAQIRAEAQAAERGAKRLQRAEESIGLAELGERQRLKELGEARQFQRGEREASQAFAGRQAGLGREFAAEQARLGRQLSETETGRQRAFAGEQARLGREFAGEQAGVGRVFAQEQRRETQKFGRGERIEAQQFAENQARLTRLLQERAADFRQTAFDESIRQADRQFNQDASVTEFNKKMAENTASQTLLSDLGLGNITDQFGDLLKF